MDKPILFSTEMVKAILAGRKTQTRRICKGARELSCSQDWHIDRCPYGKVGQKLWVRETFRHYGNQVTPEMKAYVTYKADGITREIDMTNPPKQNWWNTGKDINSFWQSSIFMPRWASRITLEVTEVRVERLQEITEDDAKAEGSPAGHILASPTIFHKGLPEYKETAADFREGFHRLWDSINGKSHPWESNPFVWAISFKEVK